MVHIRALRKKEIRRESQTSCRKQPKIVVELLESEKLGSLAAGGSQLTQRRLALQWEKSSQPRRGQKPGSPVAQRITEELRRPRSTTKSRALGKTKKTQRSRRASDRRNLEKNELKAK